MIGDGITAFDVARTARRKGAKEVVVIAQHEADDIPAGARDLAAALEEGVKVEFGALAKKVKAKGGKAQGVECVRVVREKGRRKEVRGSRFELAATTVVMATGYAPKLGDSADYLPLADSRLIANYYTGRTPEEGVFAAGDAITGSRSVIHAVAGGKRSALAVDAWLRGEDLEDLEERLAVFNGLPYLDQLRDEAQLGELGARLAERSPVWLKMGASAEPAPRATMPKVGKQKRLTATDLEVEKGYSLAAARAEATRCLQCECPSNGACDLQTLGVEYEITDNDLVVKGNLVREVEPQYEHPFIRRDMSRCIACGKCVRVCRDVAGPACYDFTGRGFTINVDTPYSDALQLADCISCGRCVTSCPTGALTFNERELASFRVDESRCILCHECVDVCPVDAIKDTNHFEDARTKWRELVAKGSELAGGHRMCAGCGAPIAVRQILMGTEDPVVVSAATGCLEVSTTIYPYTSWKGSYIHTAFENSAATLSGVETAYRALKKKGLVEEDTKFIAFGGDGGTYDIGLQSLSGAMERGHQMLYVCYDNGAYMNTGFQRSGATPQGAWTTTSPVGKAQSGKLQNRKNLTDIMIAHELGLRGPGLAARPARPRAQVGQGPGHAGRHVHQRAGALPPRLARGRRGDHRPRPRGRGDLLLAALRGRGRRVPPDLPAAPQEAAHPVAQAPGPVRPPVQARQRGDAAQPRGLGGQRVGEAPAQVRRAQRGRVAGVPAGQRLPPALDSQTATSRSSRAKGRGADRRPGPSPFRASRRRRVQSRDRRSPDPAGRSTVDRMTARRRRRRQGLTRLAVLVALIVAIIVVVVLLVRGCGGDAADEPAGTPPASPGAGASAQATKKPEPVSSLPPLVGMGDTVRFETPEGAVVRVTASGYADPGDAPAGVSADPGERIVTLKLSVTPEGAEGTALVPLPFKKADSFILIAEDDTLTVAQLADDALLGATLPPGETITHHARVLRRRVQPDPLRVHAGGGLAAALGHLGAGQVAAPEPAAGWRRASDAVDGVTVAPRMTPPVTSLLAAIPLPDLSRRRPAGSTPRRRGSRAPRSAGSAGSARTYPPVP